MTFIKAPRDIDFDKYSSSAVNSEAFYGLPEKITYCSHCIISNQRPVSANEFVHTAKTAKTSMKMDNQGKCDACRFADMKQNQIDWQERDRELVALCDKYRRDDGRYDCLLPGSGGKDSIFASHLLKYKYGMNPLTVTWAPHLQTDWGWENFKAWIDSGFDNYLFTPNSRVHRLLTRLALETICHPFQPFMMGQKAFAPKMAALLDIPLVIYGDNPAEHGDAIEKNNTPQRDWSQFSNSDPDSIFLGGLSVDALKTDFGLTKNDLEPYIPAHPDYLKSKNLDVQWLSYYKPWHVQGHYYYAVENTNFIPSPERSPGTFSKYNSIDDKIDDFHFYTTYIKFGYGRATQEACFELRNGDLTRDESVSLAQTYDGEFPERFTKEVFSYLSLPESEFPKCADSFEQPNMDRTYFEGLINRFRSPHLWQFENGEWSIRHPVWDVS